MATIAGQIRTTPEELRARSAEFCQGAGNDGDLITANGADGAEFRGPRPTNGWSYSRIIFTI